MTWFKPGVIGCYRYSYDLRVLFNLFRNRKTSHCRLLPGSLSDTDWSLEKRKTVGQLLHLDSLSMPSSPTESAPRRSPPWNGKHWWTTEKASNHDLHIISHMYRIRNTDCPTELWIFFLSLHKKTKSSYDVVPYFACVPDFAPSTQTAPATPPMLMPDYCRTIVVYIIYNSRIGRPPCPFQPKENKTLTSLYYI